MIYSNMLDVATYHILYRVSACRGQNIGRWCRELIQVVFQPQKGTFCCFRLIAEIIRSLNCHKSEFARIDQSMTIKTQKVLI